MSTQTCSGPFTSTSVTPGEPEQRLERARTRQFVDGDPDGAEHVVVAEQAPRLLADERCDVGRGRCPGPDGQPGAHPVDEAARPPIR